jgi:type II secretory ATPase GspE/PulE/Tfp pilus assembly ATPase PilB-like protein
MVGEMRDHETVSTGIEASLTGHLVFSTLHTNSAPETITRLLDMGMDPFNFADALLGVLAQRLVRIICPDCKVSYQVDPKVMNDLGEEVTKSKEPLTFYRGKGCKNCKQSGYWGRSGIYELLLVNEEIKKLISERASTQVIREVAKKTAGLVPLRVDGLRKALKVITTLDEVDRVAY